MHKGILYALLAALLFGASTPFAKMLATHVTPFALAGLLYLGSGAGLLIVYLGRALIWRGQQEAGASLGRRDLPWLAGAIAAGGIAGPVLLMLGLSLTPASSASLLLNLEGVLTALLAWCVFKENVDRRIFAGMLLIIAAGVLLSWQQMPESGAPWGPLCITGACLCWAVDNNLTRKISASDAVQIACLKGLVAGSVNLAIALAAGLSLSALPVFSVVLAAGLLGFCSYGLSLVLFVLALRHLGTARTGAYFSVAPFAGAALSLLLLGESAGWIFWLAAALMVAGIWLHLMEDHAHPHRHEEMDHAHPHRHDEHHHHAHEFEWDGKEPHVHPHRHTPLVHTHAHYPDIHHRHEHKEG